MDFSCVCRTCLSTKSLNPIFRDEETHNRHSLAVYLVTGIKVHINDGLPQNICSDCIHFLNEAFKFRKNCKVTENELLRLKVQEDGKVINNTEIVAEVTSQCFSEVISLSDLSDVKHTSEYDDNIAYGTEHDDDETPLKYFIGKKTEADLFEEQEHSDSIPDNSYSDNLQNEETHAKIELQYNTKSQKCDIKTRKKDQNSEMPYEILTANRVTCKLCQKELSIRSIDSHMARRHPGADRRKVKCELCDAYVLKEKLKRHMGMVHKSGCIRCASCKAEFDGKASLAEHLISCISKTKKRKISESGRALKECDICHKTMQKASLRMHQAIKHAGLGPVCEHCGRRFGNKFRLNEHYRAKHGYEKFKCSYCDFQSASAMAMRNHERRHRGEKPFICETCGAKFHAAYLLAQHKQSHRTERLVKCNLCPASFKANNSLHMHKSTCHSASVYQCAMCGRSYSCRHYVVKHMRHVHAYRGPVPPRPRPVEAQASAEAGDGL